MKFIFNQPVHEIMTENEISYEIHGAILDVYNNLAPVLLETAYQSAVGDELGRIRLF